MTEKVAECPEEANLLRWRGRLRADGRRPKSPSATRLKHDTVKHQPKQLGGPNGIRTLLYSGIPRSYTYRLAHLRCRLTTPMDSGRTPHDGKGVIRAVPSGKTLRTGVMLPTIRAPEIAARRRLRGATSHGRRGIQLRCSHHHLRARVSGGLLCGKSLR